VGSTFEIYDASSLLAEKDEIGRLSRKFRTLFDSKVYGFLVDSSKITISDKGERYDRMQKYDKEISYLLVTLLKNRDMTESEKKLQPIIIFTKVDAMEDKLKKKVRIERILGEYPDDDAAEIGNALFETYLKDSYKIISEYGTKYYFSWIGLDDHNRLIIEKSKEWRRVHNVYSYDMYEALVLYMRKLTHLYPDEIEEFRKMK
jgi:hypothetical protein